MLKISVLINTLNEEKNIRNCLDSVRWADEIVVVDMYSDDNTLTVAREYTNKIFFHERLGYADPARQFALEQATNEWILVVDADEVVPKALRDRLIQIAESGAWDAVSIPRLNYFFGKEMRGSGCGPLQDMQLRFFKKNMMQYTYRIHAFTQLSAEARVYRLDDEKCAFIHFSYLDVEHFLDKINRYTTIEAQNANVAGEKFSLRKVILQVFRELSFFIFKGGYKDGFYGFSLSIFMVSYRISAGLKLYILQKYHSDNPRDIIVDEYRAVATNRNMDYLTETNFNSSKKDWGQK